uniref:Uncharacterized protein n=1 Tax=Arundo donax TaxID=35708 RepID=A0A0A9G1K7_ARUDO
MCNVSKIIKSGCIKTKSLDLQLKVLIRYWSSYKSQCHTKYGQRNISQG